MLRIYPVCLVMVREVAVVLERVPDKDLCRQLRRASMSVVLNVAEGSAVRDGRRRMRYGDALRSALETQAGIEAAGSWVCGGDARRTRSLLSADHWSAFEGHGDGRDAPQLSLDTTTLAHTRTLPLPPTPALPPTPTLPPTPALPPTP